MLDSTETVFKLVHQWDYDQLILNRSIELLNFYLTKHSKALVVRFDLTFPHDHQQVFTNELMSKFIQKMIQKYKRDGRDPYYMWARETSHGLHPHYHCVILLNGHKTIHFNHVFENAKSLWGSTLNTDISGQVHHCMSNSYCAGFKNGIMIETYKQEEAQKKYNDVITQLSYLAKTAGKRDYGDPWRNFGMSELH